MKEDTRTVAEVLEQRKHSISGGCCDNFANQTACFCLEDASKREQEYKWNRGVVGVEKYTGMIIELCNKLHCTQEELIGKATRAHVFNQTFLDKPDDRLWNSADQTWWKRESKLGNLVPADPPGVHRLMSIKYRNPKNAGGIVPDGDVRWIVVNCPDHATLRHFDTVVMVGTEAENFLIRLEDKSLHVLKNLHGDYVMLCKPEDVYES